MHKIVVLFMVFIWCVVVVDGVNEDKDNLELLDVKTLSKRSVRAESSSKSEEDGDEKDKEDKNGDIGQAKKSELSENAESSDSEDDRRISTKGLVPDDFEPENNPNIHERNSKETASE